MTNGFYFLFLGLWFGAMVMLAVGAAVTFRTVRSFEPSLHVAPYDRPELANRAVPILAGGIVGNMLKALAKIQWLCATLVIIAMVMQCTVFADRLGPALRGGANLARIVLILLPLATMAADRYIVTPRIWTLRQTMFNPDLADAARGAAQTEFNRYHKMSERLHGTALVLLGAAVIASSFTLFGDPRSFNP